MMRRRISRRSLLGAGLGGAGLLSSAGCLRFVASPAGAPAAAAPPEGAEARYLSTLSFVAAALIPADDSPGAELTWATEHLRRRARQRPSDVAHFEKVAERLESEARKRNKAFAELDGPEQEAVIRAVFPTLAEDPTTPPHEQAARRVLRELMTAFFASDRLSVDDPIYHPERAKLRDPSNPSTPEFARASVVTEVFLDQSFAMWVGTGDYQRAWLAAGYVIPPGVCKPYDEYTRAPSEL